MYYCASQQNHRTIAEVASNAIRFGRSPSSDAAIFNEGCRVTDRKNSEKPIECLLMSVNNSGASGGQHVTVLTTSE